MPFFGLFSFGNQSRQERLKALAFAFLAGAIAYALNWRPLSLPGGIQILAGSVPALYVAKVYGPWAGVLAGALGAFGTWQHWGHPYWLILLGVEGFVVGWFTCRYRWPALYIDVAYWGLAGLPTLFLLWRFELTPQSVSGAGLEIDQPLNGVLAILIIRLALRVWESRGGGLQIPDRYIRFELLEVLAVVAILPTIGLSMVHGRLAGEKRAADAIATLEEAADHTRHRIEDYVDKHLTGVRALARAVEEELTTGRRLEPSEAAHWNQVLEAQHSLLDGFISMLAANQEGSVVGASAHTPLPAPRNRSTGSIRDRSYFQQPLQSGQAFVSEAFLGRGFGQDPIVALSAPVLDPVTRRPAGIVEGSLDLTRFRTFAASAMMVRDSRFYLLDSARRVIFASKGYRPLE